MARIRIHSDTTPLRIDPSKGPVWICQCGLSRAFPVCDGSHEVARREAEDTVYWYDEDTLTPRSTARPSSGCDLASLSSIIADCCAVRAGTQLIAEDAERGWRVLHTRYGTAAFNKIKSVRASGGSDSPGGDEPKCYDRLADHYLLLLEDVPALAMRVNRFHRGPVDCEEFYPRQLCERFQQFIGSASKFVRSGETKCSLTESRAFIQAVRHHQVATGMVLDIVNAHERMIPYWRRMGYEPMPHSYFVHPRLGADSHVMYLFASRDWFPDSDPDTCAVLEAVQDRIRARFSNCECGIAKATDVRGENFICPVEPTA